MTIKDIAKLAKVSVTTVSLVLNNKDDNIRKETRDRVLKVIKENNYVPNSVARSMITKKSNIIGLIIPDITNLYFAEIARSVESASKKLSYNVIVCNADDNPTTEAEYIRILKEKHVDGLIIVPAALSNHEELQKLRSEGYPLVILDRKTEEENEAVVCFNNFEAGYMATTHLLNLGHKNIACVTGPKGNMSSIERLAGYKAALNKSKVQINDQIIVEGDYRIESGEVAANSLIDNHDISAIFAFNDMMAYGVYRSIHSHSLLIPSDISVIGIDDLMLSTVVSPSLTTIKQPASKMGSASVDLLESIIRGVNKTTYQEFDPLLICRDSVKDVSK